MTRAQSQAVITIQKWTPEKAEALKRTVELCSYPTFPIDCQIIRDALAEIDRLREDNDALRKSCDLLKQRMTEMEDEP